MGSGGIYHCRVCGFRSGEIWFGCGFLGNSDNPTIRGMILDGEYGDTPKSILESNQDAHFYADSIAYRCRCGNFSSKGAVHIFSSEGKPLYRPSMNCGRCGKRMRAIRDPPGNQECPECGMPLDFELTVMWD